MLPTRLRRAPMDGKDQLRKSGTLIH
jgi:hypothetical protein